MAEPRSLQRLKVKGPAPKQEQAPRSKQLFWLEVKLHAKLKIASIESASSLAEVAINVFVMCSTTRSRQEKIGTVEHVEGVSIELHAHSLCDLEDLRQCHIGSPVSRTDK